MYVCGPTVYGPPHLGHGRATLVYDVLRRYLEWTGLQRAATCRNITDIDDKIIERATREGRPWQEITTKCEAVWFKAMDAIGRRCARPTSRTPPSTSTQMVEMIGELVDIGSAYVTDDGVYLSVRSRARLRPARPPDARRHAGRRRRPRGRSAPTTSATPPTSRCGSSPSRASRAWPSPWGEGRPGWHSECVVMSLDLLGEGFDLHCGGQDLKFPHHENERAQAVALGKRFANHWMHHGFVVDAEGEKMSKSLGNFTNLLDLIEHDRPARYRMLLLQSHYRSPVSVSPTRSAPPSGRSPVSTRSPAGLPPAWPTADAPIADGARPRSASGWTTTSTRRAPWRWCSTPSAAATPRSTPATARRGSRAGGHRRRLCAAVGLVLDGGRDVPAGGAGQGRRRSTRPGRPRTSAAADAMRAELQADGWLVETTKPGTTVRR